MGQAQECHIGVAIEIPEPYGSELIATRRNLQDPQAEKVPAHVTLLPPMQLDYADISAVQAHLKHAAAAQDPFKMLLRGTGTFRPVSEVVFVAIAAGIAECEYLESRVRTGILYQELQFNYHPHVTIAHNVSPAKLDEAFTKMANFEAEFVVEKFTLYTYSESGVWHPTTHFSLGS